jgi:hypothetical protein
MKIPYQISLNQIVEFSEASMAKRISITKQQLLVNPFLIPWYQLAKQRIKKYFYNLQEKKPVLEAIDILKKRVPNSKRQESDRNVSIEALQLVSAMKMPDFLKNLEYEVLKIKNKSIQIGSVSINVNPDIIIKAKIGNKITYGGLKIHICKTKPFNLPQCYHIASMVHRFLVKEVADEGEIVSPELCFCFDVFGNRIVASPVEYSIQTTEIEAFCLEFKNICDQLNIE